MGEGHVTAWESLGERHVAAWESLHLGDKIGMWTLVERREIRGEKLGERRKNRRFRIFKIFLIFI